MGSVLLKQVKRLHVIRMGVQIGAKFQYHKFQGLEFYQRITGQGAPLGLEVEGEIQSGK